MALGISKQELVSCFSDPERGMTYGDLRLCIDGKSTGAVRVSAGIVSNFDDVFRFAEFAKKFLDGKRPQAISIA